METQEAILRAELWAKSQDSRVDPSEEKEVALSLLGEIRKLQTALSESERARTELQHARLTRLADVERITAWMDNPKRKQAIFAFTEGPERQIAYRLHPILMGEMICPECGLRQNSIRNTKVEF